MSVKIRISYTEEEELAGVIRLLSPVLKSWKKSRKQEGRYKNAYAMLKHEANSRGTREENINRSGEEAARRKEI